MNRIKIISLLKSETPRDNIIAKGWVRTRRDSSNFSFIEINDGSCLENLQIIADESLENYEDIKKLTTGSAVAIFGNLIESQGKGQQWEMNAKTLEVISLAPDSYPLQKKRHTDEFLRTIAHLRPRTNKYGAVFRIRSELSFAIHRFFREKGFRYIHSPIITGSDCEGAGELFKVTTIDFVTSNTIYCSGDFQVNWGDGNYIDYRLVLGGEEGDIKLGDIITVELQSIDQAAFDFYKTANSVNASGSTGGGPSSTSAAPTNPVTNWNNKALGFFTAYTVSKKSIKIEE